MPCIPKYLTFTEQIESLKFSIENLHNKIDKLKVEIEELKKIKESEDKMTKEITQQERLDLTDEKIRAENLAYTIDIFKNFELLAKGMSVKDFKAKTHCDYIENQRLKEQLNREIHINRKMKNAINLALSYLASPDRIKEDVPNEELAYQELRQTLKEIDKEE